MKNCPMTAPRFCPPSKVSIEFQIAVYLSVLHRTQKPPLVRGKRSAVAVVNDSPVDCQSRDRVARRQLARIFDF